MDEDNVLYCSSCLSLKIMDIEGTNMCYCGECGCTEVKETDIDTWDKMYEKKYGKKFVVKKKRYFTY